MPQKPQDRAKEKRRLTRRLEKWRAKHAQQSASEGSSTAQAQKTSSSSAR